MHHSRAGAGRPSRARKFTAVKVERNAKSVEPRQMRRRTFPDRHSLIYLPDSNAGLPKTTPERLASTRVKPKDAQRTTSLDWGGSCVDCSVYQTTYSALKEILSKSIYTLQEQLHAHQGGYEAFQGRGSLPYASTTLRSLGIWSQ